MTAFSVYLTKAQPSQGPYPSGGSGTNGGSGGSNVVGNASGLTNVAPSTNVYYVALNGSDTTGVVSDQNRPFFSLQAALTNLNLLPLTQTNNKIKLGTGVFDTKQLGLTNQVPVEIEGDGIGSTFIIGGGEYLTNGPMIGPCTNIWIRNLTLWTTNVWGTNGTDFDVPLGGGGINPSSGFIGTCRCFNVRFIGDTDNVFPWSTLTSTNFYYFDTCQFNSRWDLLNMNNQTNSWVYYNNCDFYFPFTPSLSGTGNSKAVQPYRAVVETKGNVFVQNSRVWLTANTNGQQGLVVPSGNAGSGILNLSMILISNNLATAGGLSISNADILVNAATAGRTNAVTISQVSKYDGTPLGIITNGVNTRYTITYPPTVDPSQISEMLIGTPLSLPTRAVNFGGTLTVTNQTFLGQEFANTNITTNVSITPVLEGLGSIPTIVTNSGNGSGSATATVTLEAGSTSLAGRITVVTGTAPAANAAMFTMTYATTLPFKPTTVFSPVGQSAGAALGVCIQTNTTTQLIMQSGTPALTGGGVFYSWTYHTIIENQ